MERLGIPGHLIITKSFFRRWRVGFPTMNATSFVSNSRGRFNGSRCCWLRKWLNGDNWPVAARQLLAWDLGKLPPRQSGPACACGERCALLDNRGDRHPSIDCGAFRSINRPCVPGSGSSVIEGRCQSRSSQSSTYASSTRRLPVGCERPLRSLKRITTESTKRHPALAGPRGQRIDDEAVMTLRKLGAVRQRV